MPEQAEAGHVGHRVWRIRSQGLGRLAIEGAHRPHRRVERALGRSPVALCLQHEAGAERLREEHGIAGAGAALRPDAVRVHGADDGEPVLRLVVADRVPAGQDRSGRAYRLVRSGKHLPEHLGGKLLRERRHGERQQRRPTHGEHVVERVRGSDRAEVAGVVDHRWEEVDGEHERALVVEPVDGRIVGRVEPHQQIRGVGRSEGAEQRLEPRGRVLGRAPAGASEAGERRRGHTASVRTPAGKASRRWNRWLAGSSSP